MRRNDSIARFGAFRLLSDTMRACEKMLIQGEAQFLLCHHHPHMDSELDTERFTSVRMGQDVLIPYSAARPDSHEPIWTADGKTPFPYLSFSSESGLGRIVANAAFMGRMRKSMRTAFTSDLTATLLAMVRSGDGIAFTAPNPCRTGRAKRQDYSRRRSAKRTVDPCRYSPVSTDKQNAAGGGRAVGEFL